MYWNKEESSGVRARSAWYTSTFHSSARQRNVRAGEAPAMCSDDSAGTEERVMWKKGNGQHPGVWDSYREMSSLAVSGAERAISQLRSGSPQRDSGTDETCQSHAPFLMTPSLRIDVKRLRPDQIWYKCSCSSVKKPSFILSGKINEERRGPW